MGTDSNSELFLDKCVITNDSHNNSVIVGFYKFASLIVSGQLLFCQSELWWFSKIDLSSNVIFPILGLCVIL